MTFQRIGTAKHRTQRGANVSDEVRPLFSISPLRCTQQYDELRQGVLADIRESVAVVNQRRNSILHPFNIELRQIVGALRVGRSS